jgi:hypothetical protein
MRAFLAVLMGLVACQQARSAPTPKPTELVVAVDPRAELMAILFRLAGNPESQRAYDTPYLRAVDAHFAPYKDHPAVAATRALHVGWDAPYALAVYLDPATFAPIRPLDPRPPGLDERWKRVDLAAYVASVQDFARATDFAGFFAGQRQTLAAVEQRDRDAFAGQPILSFYDALFGRRAATYQVSPGLLTAGMGYGVRAVDAAGGEYIYQVVYLENLDAQGLPRPGVRSLEYLVHELGHPYVNPIFEARADDMLPVAQPLFDRTHDAMMKQSYVTPKIMVNESVVRALQVLWLREHVSAQEAERSLREQVGLGFAWTGAVVDAIVDLRAHHREGAPSADELYATVRGVFAAWGAKTK